MKDKKRRELLLEASIVLCQEKKKEVRAYKNGIIKY